MKARIFKKFPCIGPGNFLERNRNRGTKLISSFLPTFPGFRIGFDRFSSLGRPRKIISSRVPRPGRPRVSKFTKPIRKPEILGFGELILLVPFFQDFGAFKMFLIDLVRLGAEPSNLELMQYESPLCLNQNVGWKPKWGTIFDSSFFPTFLRAFVLD